MPRRDHKPPRRPSLRLVELPPAEPRWSGRRSVAVMIGLGALLWVLVAAGGWLLARALT